MKHYFSLILLLIPVLAFSAQTHILAGKVLNTDGAPVEGKVILENKITQKEVASYFTNAEGKYMFVTEPGGYNLIVEAPGYRYHTEEITISEDSPERIVKNLIVKPLSEETETPERTVDIQPKKEKDTTADVPAGSGNSASGSKGFDTVTRIQLLTRDNHQYIKTNFLKFKENSAELTPHAKKELDQIAEFLKVNDNLIIETKGYAHEAGSDEDNSSLSKQRAQAVSDYLASREVNPAQLSSEGYGSNKETASVEIEIVENTLAQNTSPTFEEVKKKDNPNPQKKKKRLKLSDKAVEEFNNTVIYFEKRKDEIAPAAYTILDSVAGFLKTYPYVQIQVQGHTDSKGFAKGNKKLSERRAQSVINYLTEKGIEKKRITWQAFGEENPVASNKTKEGRADNRRVEFEIVGIDAPDEEPEPQEEIIEEQPEVAEAESETEEEEPPAEEKEEEKPAEPATGGESAWYNTLLNTYGNKELDGLVYSVQVGAFSKPLNAGAKIYTIANDIKEDVSGGIYRYSTGSFSTLSAAHAHRDEIRQKGIPDAFVVAFHNGERISLARVDDLFEE